MRAGAAVPAAGLPAIDWRRDRTRDHRFYTGMALAVLLVAFVGFAPTYYLGRFFHARPLTPLVHVHAVLFTSWCLLFVAQASLVASNRVALHRRMGVFSACLALVLLVVGYLTAIASARRAEGPPGRDPIVFLSLPLGTLVVFALLFGAALWLRRQRDTHKRLMVLATIVLVSPAFPRMRSFLGGEVRTILYAGTALFVLACWIWDRKAHGRIHPAFLWGGIFVLVSLPVRILVGYLPAWRPIAEWLVR